MVGLLGDDSGTQVEGKMVGDSRVVVPPSKMRILGESAGADQDVAIAKQRGSGVPDKSTNSRRRRSLTNFG
jgi:hypothetical protein